MKTKMLQLKLTNVQKVVIDKNLQVSNYVYNKTIKYINDNKLTNIHKLKLRDKLVTLNSKTENIAYIKFRQYITKLKKQTNLLNKRKLKDIVKLSKLHERIKYVESVFAQVKKDIKPLINSELKSWEIDVHKDIRAEAVFEACKNIKTAKNNVNTGLIKFFQMKYKTKKAGKYSMGLTKAMFKLTNGKFYFTNKKFKGNDSILHFSKRNSKLVKTFADFKDSKIIKKQGKYFLALAIENKKVTEFKTSRVIGIDPGVRTFLTCYSEDHGIEYKFNNDLTDKLDKLKSILKNKSNLRKRTLTKIDKRKENVINELHWKCANHLVKNYDVIILEKFDSQGFVKGGKNKTLNRRTNNLKPYLFRQRLLYKADCYDKKVLVVNSHHTTKTCSNCGNHQDIGMSKIYDCKKCNQVLERDFNAAKNILMKGLLN
jgi:putative transposase